MTASSGVVISNLAYLVGAVVLAIIGGFVVWLRHRQPKSVDANVESFQRGLRALAPDEPVAAHARRRGHGTDRSGPRVTSRPGARPASRPALTMIEIADQADSDDGPAGAETG
jgi:hypothetical protein